MIVLKHMEPVEAISVTPATSRGESSHAFVNRNVPLSVGVTAKSVRLLSGGVRFWSLCTVLVTVGADTVQLSVTGVDQV